MIFHIPHASSEIPLDLRSALMLDDQALEDELRIMTDAFTDELFGAHAEADDTVITFPLSRLIVDPERFLDDLQEMMSWVGMGVIHTQTSAGDPLRNTPSLEEKDELIRRFYVPHHKMLNDAARNELDRFDAALILDCHSYPSEPMPFEFDQDSERPDICLGTDSFHTPHALVVAAQQAAATEGLTTAINHPFSGTLVPNRYWESDKRVSSIMIEVNRSRYMNEGSGERSDRFDACKASMGKIVGAIRHAWRKV